ncbi:MurR/RpiR family transcriptional regulator [Paenibacillus thailandensis]|uniref:MurR/RpiR family transcriptional regulator n=1 Tax=Paenibacillus thailandensis TaxID=393250 RepID=A0ABW5R3L0_9BACL
MASFQPDFDLAKLSKSQQIIANYVLGAINEIPYCTEEDIAAATGVSTATVSRFWKAIGYDNLKAFKKHLLRKEHATPARKMEHILSRVEHEEADVFREIAGIAAANLDVSAARLDRGQFAAAVQAVHAARTVYIFGSGASSALTELLRFRLNRIGIRAVPTAGSGSELLEQLVHAEEGDIVWMFGFVRRSPELTVLLEQSKASRYGTVLVTDLLLSDMLAQSDIVLQLDRGELEGFHSMASAVALVEALVVAVTKLRKDSAMNKLDQLHGLRKTYASLLPK